TRGIPHRRVRHGRCRGPPPRALRRTQRLVAAHTGKELRRRFAIRTVDTRRSRSRDPRADQPRRGRDFSQGRHWYDGARPIDWVHAFRNPDSARAEGLRSRSTTTIADARCEGGGAALGALTRSVPATIASACRRERHDPPTDRGPYTAAPASANGAD